jgi:hypothetical protein
MTTSNRVRPGSGPKARTVPQARAVLLRSVADLVAAMAAHLEGLRRRVLAGADAPDSLTGFDTFVHSILESEEIPVLGMGFIADRESTPDGAIHWWYNGADSQDAMRPLAVGTQPQAFDFYDVAASEWWQNAAGSQRPTASGPYVDFSGTNAYIVTFSLGVRRADELLGTVAVDIAVGVLQGLWQDALLDLPRPTSVVDRQGLVIATNAGALLGSLVDLEQVTGSRQQNISGTSWMLIEETRRRTT